MHGFAVVVGRTAFDLRALVHVGVCGASQRPPEDWVVDTVVLDA
jgi:hypothetical protein